jgi:hypothetical protein
METPNAKTGFGLIGVGAAACVACCAGPILGFLAATGIASVLGAVVFGAAGLVVVLAVAAVVWQRRRRRQRCQPSEPTEPTPVAAPQLRTRG